MGNPWIWYRTTTVDTVPMVRCWARTTPGEWLERGAYVTVPPSSQSPDRRGNERHFSPLHFPPPICSPPFLSSPLFPSHPPPLLLLSSFPTKQVFLFRTRPLTPASPASASCMLDHRYDVTPGYKALERPLLRQYSFVDRKPKWPKNSVRTSK